MPGFEHGESLFISPDSAMSEIEPHRIVVVYGLPSDDAIVRRMAELVSYYGEHHFGDNNGTDQGNGEGALLVPTPQTDSGRDLAITV